jgi:thiosulfate/3-mercaptopyruvate sulfurtransferase
MKNFMRDAIGALMVVLAISFTAISPSRAEELKPLVDIAWLKNNYISSSVVVLDVRGQFAKVKEKEFAAGHIPGSVWAPYQGKWRTKRGNVVGVLPPVEKISTYISSLGVSNDKTVVIVPGGLSALEFGSAAYVYWSFKYLGHDKVAILNGGYKAWTTDKSNPVQQGASKPYPATFTPNVRANLLASTEAVNKNLKDGSVYIDARPASQYQGLKKHPKAVRFGRLPGATSLDQSVFYDPKTNRLKGISTLQSLLPENLKNKDTKLVSYCNTGHWASTNWFVMSELLGHKNVTLYDDSMVGWTRQASLPMDSDRTRWHDVQDWWNNLTK